MRCFIKLLQGENTLNFYRGGYTVNVSELRVGGHRCLRENLRALERINRLFGGHAGESVALRPDRI